MRKSFTLKLWNLMKIGAAQAMIALMVSGVSLAHDNLAQILDKEVSVVLTDATFDQALREIGRAANVRFAYSIDQLRVNGTVSLKAEHRPLRELLHELLDSRHILFKVHEQEGVITLKKSQPELGDVPPVMEGAPPDEPAQVTGTVTDATTQQPMPGVNIIVKGTTRGTTTDADGKFTIDAVADDVLVFSFIGYSPAEIKLAGQREVSVSLTEDITSLKEVVVNAGYYSTTRETQTGNIARVEAKDIQKQPVSNPLAALQGRVAGVEIVQQTGVPGGSFQVRIRGQNSIASGNDPLYVIDGVPFISSTLTFPQSAAAVYPIGTGTSPLNSINPADIESIEILKDADATSIYGSRGSNGVVLITTKKGKTGQTKVDFTYSAGGGKVTRKMDLMKTPQYLAMRREAYRNDNLVPTADDAPDLLVWDTTRYTDWQKELIGKTALYRDAQLSVSGGEKYTQFSAGAGYHRETTVFPGDNSDERLSTHMMVTNTSPNEKLKTSVSLTYSINNTNLLKQDLTSLALSLAPDAPPLYNESGGLNWGPTAWNGVNTLANPLGYTKARYNARTNTLVGNAVVSYRLLPNLELRANVGFTNTGMKAVTATPLSSVDPAFAVFSQNTSIFANNSVRNWIAEPQANWKRQTSFGNFDVLAGASFLEQINDGNVLNGTGFSSEALMQNINSADQITKSVSLYSQYRYQAFFGRINYSLKDKYILNITGRRDGSSRFGPGKQFSTFGAVGGAWIFSREAFVSNNLGFLSFGKLRASYGTTGNDQIGDYQYLDTYSTNGSGIYNGSAGLSPQRLYNPGFAWEKVSKIESTLEFGFLRDRLTTTFTYYRNRSSSQLVGTPLPPTTGFTSIQSNFGALVQNKGVEVQLFSSNIQTSRFSWTTSINWTIPQNKLVSFPGLETSQYANSYVVGQPLNILMLYHYTGVDPATGMYRFQDVNGDNAYDVLDRKVIKFRGRNFYGGITNSFRYEGFQLDFLLEFVKQSGLNYLFNNTVAPGRLPVNNPTFISNRWTREGDITPIQKFSTLTTYQTAYSDLLSSERVVTDASYVRLKNISLSWTPPSEWVKKIRAQNARFYINCQNLLTFTSYKGLDPETQTAALPPLRMITAGIQLTF